MITLYYHPASAPCLKVHYFLAESGLPFEASLVRLDQGEHRSAQFQKLNPLMKVPVVMDHTGTYVESNAIIRYLAQAHQKDEWYPSATRERYEVDMWTDFISFHVNAHLQTVVGQLLFNPMFGRPIDQKVVQERIQLAMPNLEVLDKHLMNRRLIVGAHPTLADLNLLSFLPMMTTRGVPMGEIPFVERWLKGLMSRPALAKVWQECPFAKAK